jgi:hypothetical protein
MCFYFLGVPTVPLLPPQVNQSLTPVPPMNPTTTLPSKQWGLDMCVMVMFALENISRVCVCV